MQTNSYLNRAADASGVQGRQTMNRNRPPEARWLQSAAHGAELPMAEELEVNR